MKFRFHERIQAILPFGGHHVYGFAAMQLGARKSVNPTPFERDLWWPAVNQQRHPARAQYGGISDFIGDCRAP
jgi:hypothetical protein